LSRHDRIKKHILRFSIYYTRWWWGVTVINFESGKVNFDRE
jgi:hypothetical protein